MKVLKLMSVAVLLVGVTACSQNAPKEVKDAFNSKFPSASEVEWEKENDSEWEAEFKLDGKEYSANFSTDGNWLETEHEIDASELPELVKNTINKEFSGYEIEKAEIAEKTNGTVYEITLEKGEEEIEVVIDDAGKIIKQETKKEDEDED